MPGVNLSNRPTGTNGATKTMRIVLKKLMSLRRSFTAQAAAVSRCVMYAERRLLTSSLSMPIHLTPRLPSTCYAELELGYRSTVIVRDSRSLLDYHAITCQPEVCGHCQLNWISFPVSVFCLFAGCLFSALCYFRSARLSLSIHGVP